MKFRKKKESSSSNDVNLSKKQDDVTVKACLDYFSSFNGTCKNIIDHCRYVLHKNSKTTASTYELERDMNEIFVRERTKHKYGISQDDFDLANAEWFPRLRTLKQHKSDEDADSISSSNSDLAQDGFAGQFSWETRSLQEMRFPSTPELSAKDTGNTLSKFMGKGKKKRKMSQDVDNEAGDDHRTFERIDQLAIRLKANYDEAKAQREKYLNQKNVESADVDPEEIRKSKSISGLRHLKKPASIKTTDEQNLILHIPTTKNETTLQTLNNSVVSTPTSPSLPEIHVSQESSTHRPERKSTGSRTLSPTSTSSSNLLTSELFEAMAKFSSVNSLIERSEPNETSQELDISAESSTHANKFAEDAVDSRSNADSLFFSDNPDSKSNPDSSFYQDAEEDAERLVISNDNVNHKNEKVYSRSDSYRDTSSGCESYKGRSGSDSSSVTEKSELMRSLSKSERKNSIRGNKGSFKRRDSARRKHTSKDSVDMNMNSPDALSPEPPSPVSTGGNSEGLNNIMDMLANW